MQYARNTVLKGMESEEVDSNRTILGKLVKAVDPETKKKLSQLEIVTNSSLLMYAIQEVSLT
jgi:hypothetical protein